MGVTPETYSQLLGFDPFEVAFLLHAIFIYWTFLDLIRLPLHTYILSSNRWDIPIYFLSLPFIFAAMALIILASISIAYGILSGICAIAKPLWALGQDGLPEGIAEPNRCESPPRVGWGTRIG
jgi:hypothetical protein